MPMESVHRPLPGLRQMVADSGALYLANAVVGFIFAASGPVAIILAVGARGGLSESDLSSWIFGSFFINGLITLLFCTLYRQPLVFFWTIPGTVLVGPALSHLRWAEVIGAFLATGGLMLVLGLSGWVRRAMQAVPMPIVMGMVRACSCASAWAWCTRCAMISGSPRRWSWPFLRSAHRPDGRAGCHP